MQIVAHFAVLINTYASSSRRCAVQDRLGMARDVDQMLVQILGEPVNGDEEAGRAKLKELTKAGRYQRDVN